MCRLHSTKYDYGEQEVQLEKDLYFCDRSHSLGFFTCVLTFQWYTLKFHVTLSTGPLFSTVTRLSISSSDFS